MSQTALAERLTELGMKVDGSAVTRMERGTRAITVNELVTIAKALDASVSYLLHEASMPEVELQIARRDVADLCGHAAVVAADLDAARARVKRLAAEAGVKPWVKRGADGQEEPIPGAPS